MESVLWKLFVQQVHFLVEDRVAGELDTGIVDVLKAGGGASLGSVGARGFFE